MATAFQHVDFAKLMPQVAQRLLGEPNPRLSKGTRLRFGTHGSMEVDADEGWFCDHEAGDARGGVLDLIQHKAACDRAGALRWLEQEGLKDRTAGAVAETTAKKFYDYRDEDGTMLFRVERRGKGMSPPFLQHGPDGKGGFHSATGCMQGVCRVPYRLPELAAADPAAIVYVCEGEKDVDRLAREGLVATTNPGGAGKFSAELAVYLHGRRVVALEDNDDAGAKHVAGVLKVLAGVAAQVVALKLPDLPPKGDVSDWLDATSSIGTNSVFDLQRLAKEALTEPTNLLAFYDVADWEGLAVPPRRWLLTDWLPIGEAALLTGAGSVGKSLVSQQLAATVAVGTPFLGVDTPPVRSLYITCEDGREEAQRRQRDIASAIGRSFPRGQCLVASWKGELDLELVMFDAERRMKPTERFHKLRATVLALGVRFLVLDNTSHVFGGDENIKREVAGFVNLLNGLSEEIDGVVLVLGHPNKTGLNNPDAGSANQFGGSVAWENQVRSRMFMSFVADDDDARELTNPKANYAAKGGNLMFRWHRGAFVRDKDVPDTHKDLAETVKANADNAAFLACLAERNQQRRQVSEKPTAANYAPKQFLGMPQAKGLTKSRLEKAMDRLFRINAIERSFLYRDSGEGKNIFGLRAVNAGKPDGLSNDPETSPETYRKQLPESTGNPPETTGNTPPIYEYIPGGPTGAGPPVEETEPASTEDVIDPAHDGHRGTSNLILAPGETGDDVDL